MPANIVTSPSPLPRTRSSRVALRGGCLAIATAASTALCQPWPEPHNAYHGERFHEIRSGIAGLAPEEVTPAWLCPDGAQHPTSCATAAAPARTPKKLSRGTKSVAKARATRQEKTFSIATAPRRASTGLAQPQTATAIISIPQQLRAAGRRETQHAGQESARGGRRCLLRLRCRHSRRPSARGRVTATRSAAAAARDQQCRG